MFLLGTFFFSASKNIARQFFRPDSVVVRLSWPAPAWPPAGHHPAPSRAASSAPRPLFGDRGEVFIKQKQRSYGCVCITRVGSHHESSL